MPGFQGPCSNKILGAFIRSSTVDTEILTNIQHNVNMQDYQYYNYTVT